MDYSSNATPAQKAAANAKGAAMTKSIRTWAPSPNAQPRNSAGQFVGAGQQGGTGVSPPRTAGWGLGPDTFTVEQMTAARNRGVPPEQLFPQGVYTPSSGGTGLSLSGNDVPGMNRTAAENAAYNAAKLAAMSQSERNTMYRLQAENAAKAAARNGTSMRDSIYGTPDPNSPGQRFGPPAYTGPQYGPPVSNPNYNPSRPIGVGNSPTISTPAPTYRPPASSSGTPLSTIPFVGNPVRTPYQTAPTYTPATTSNPNNYRPPNNVAGYTGPGYTPPTMTGSGYTPAQEAFIASYNSQTQPQATQQYRDPLYDSNGNWITGKPAQNQPVQRPPAPSTTPVKYTNTPSPRDYWNDPRSQAPVRDTPPAPITSPSTSGMTGSVQQWPSGSSPAPTNYAAYNQSMAGVPYTPPRPTAAQTNGGLPPWTREEALDSIGLDRYGRLGVGNNYQQPQQPIPGSWADQMQQRTATRYPTTTPAGQINASSPADQRQQNITNSQATRTQAQIESQRITPEEIERNRITREEQGPLVLPPTGSGPAQGYNRIYGGAAGSGYQDVLSKTGGGQTFYAPSAIGNNTPITPPPSRWPAPNQPDTSNNYQQPPLTYGPRQTAATGWVPSPQPQSSQAVFDYGPPPQMSDRVSRLAGAGAPAKVPAWMTAGNKR